MNELKEPHDRIVHRLCIWMCIKKGRGRGREREEAAAAPHELLTGAVLYAFLSIWMHVFCSTELISISCHISISSLKVIRAAFAHAMNESESSPSSFPGYAVSSTFASSSAFDSSTAQRF